MESKEVVVDKLLCMACLCVGRALDDITDPRMQRYYMETLNEVPLCNVPQTCPSLCWECKAMLRKAVYFKEQVKDCYRILQTYTNENLHECLLTDITRTPRFTTHRLDPISVPPPNPRAKTEEYILPLLYKEEEQSWPDDFDLDSIPVTEPLEKPVIVEVDVPGEKPDLQEVCIKEENNYWPEDSDDVTANELKSPLAYETHIADLENDIKNIIHKTKKRKRKKSPAESLENLTDLGKEISNGVQKKTKKRKNMKDKLKKEKKVVKRIKTENNLLGLKTEKVRKMIIVELSYEDMLVEREKESTRENYVKATFRCESCLIGFHYAKSYEAHISAKHSPELGNYICPICKTVIASVDSFTTHYKRHMRRYECGVCGKRTQDVKAMEQHYYSAHQILLREYKCNICGKISNSIDTHRYHRNTHKARIPCGQCDKSFIHRAGLLSHRQTVHEVHSDYLCPECGKTFRWKTSLKRHLEKHAVTKDEVPPAAVCADCAISFQSVSSYQRHLKNSLKHVSRKQLRFICDHCNRRFADKTKLRDHIEEKHLLKTYQCHICSKPSKNRVSLDQHIRNVHKGRPNNKVCHFCGKGFPTKLQLENHLRTHTGERPFICEVCPTTFSQQSNLYKHNRQVHLNKKPKRYYPLPKHPPPPPPPELPPPHKAKPPPVYFSTDRNFAPS